VKEYIKLKYTPAYMESYNPLSQENIFRSKPDFEKEKEKEKVRIVR